MAITYSDQQTPVSSLDTYSTDIPKILGLNSSNEAAILDVKLLKTMFDNSSQVPSLVTAVAANTTNISDLAASVKNLTTNIDDTITNYFESKGITFTKDSNGNYVITCKGGFYKQ
jgi:hypothetical protein